jgi:hypothetical protein
MLLAPTLAADDVTPEEITLWNMVKDTDDIDELDIYLETYPSGQYTALAERQKWLLTLSSADIGQIEAYIDNNPHSPFIGDAIEAIWQLVDGSKAIMLYETFILKYPNSPFVSLAEVRLKRTTERQIWEEAKSAGSIEALKVYLAEHPQSRFVADAESLMWSMVRDSRSIEVLRDFVRSYPDSKLTTRAEELEWEWVRESRDEDIIQRYVNEYPNGRFQGLARLYLLRLQKRAQKVETTEVTVLDHLSRLIWQKHIDTSARWEQAQQYCDELILDGMDNWRLPTIVELRSLDSISHYFPNPPYENYWSTTTFDRDDSGAWIVGTQGGVVNIDYKRNIHSIRCVRTMPTAVLSEENGEAAPAPFSADPKTPPVLSNDADETIPAESQ